MLIARRNSMAVGKRLPYDAEIEYLGNASGGGQFIDTGINLTNNTTCEVVFQPLEFPDLNGAAYVVCGSRSDISNLQRTIVLRAKEDILNYICIQKGSFATNWKSRYVTGFVTARIGPESGSIDDSTFALPSVPSANTPIALFGQYMAGGTPSSWSVAEYQMRVASFRVWQGQNLVRDLAPVRFTNELGQPEGAMYDRLGVGGMNPDGSARTDGLYRNRGTGAFSIGPDK